MRTIFLILGLLYVIGFNSLLNAGETIWVEGENPSSGEYHPHPWYSRAVDKEQLSGGDFASSFTKKSETVLGYEVKIPAAGDYHLWLRANPNKVKLSWRIDGGDWKLVDTSTAIDKINIAKDGKPDLRYIGWMNVGTVSLKAGTTTIGIKFHSKTQNHGSLDAFVLTTDAFMPSGKNKPGEQLTNADKGYFAFDPGIDAFEDAALDLRQLNEKVAGQSGPLRQKGGKILLGDGSPVRFWAANAGPAKSPAGNDYLAKRLAKYGFNAARFHGLLADRSGNDPLAVSKEKLERIHYAVKAYKEQGIYIHLSTYFPLWMKVQSSDRISGAKVGERPTALLLFDERFQQIWKAWAKGVLTSKNPYTGMTLAEDPAVGFFELQNEDSFFFYTFAEKRVGREPWARLERMFLDWITEKHGSLAKAKQAWGGGSDHKHDGGDRAGLFDAWFMTADGMKQGGDGRRARIHDQMRFLAEKQRQTYAELTDYVKNELGFKGLVTASNWKAADDTTGLAIERWTYTVTDVIDRHGYFGGTHKGERSAYSVLAGHQFKDRAAVLEPSETPLGYTQLMGRPHIHSENAWNKPNRLNADSQLLISSYCALQGVDGWFMFAAHSGDWNKRPTNKWPMFLPSHYGQSPAAALQYRRGDVEESEAVLRQVQTADELFQPGQGGIIEGKNDDFRIKEAPKATNPGSIAGFDPLSYYVGRVERAIVGVDGVPRNLKNKAIDLSRYIDRNRKLVTSITNQLRWDYGKGLVTVNTPRSQAATGFLSKVGTIKLGDVQIASGNHYGTVHVISLDGKPLAQSRRILIQAFTREQMYGFRSSGSRITDLGSAPINIELIDATVTLPGSGWKAIALTGNGYRRDAVAVDGNRIKLPTDSLYTIVAR